MTTDILKIGKIVLDGSSKKPPKFPEVKFREPVSFDAFVEKKLSNGELTYQLKFQLEELLDQWREYNKGCFEIIKGALRDEHITDR